MKILQKLFEESALSRTQIFQWLKELSKSPKVMESWLYASRLYFISDDNIEKVIETVFENRRVGSQNLLSVDSTQFSYCLGHEIINERHIQKDLNHLQNVNMTSKLSNIPMNGAIKISEMKKSKFAEGSEGHPSRGL